MRYAILQQAIKEITESHKSGLTFVTGLEEDIEAGSIQYPIVFLQPPSFTMPLFKDEVGADSWNIHLETQEQLQPGASTAEKQEALDRTREYLRDIVLKFVYLYGVDGATVTVNNLTEVLDFETTTTAPALPFIDIDENITGWQVDFTIQDGKQADLCHLSDVFE